MLKPRTRSIPTSRSIWAIGRTATQSEWPASTYVVTPAVARTSTASPSRRTRWSTTSHSGAEASASGSTTTAAVASAAARASATSWTHGR